MAMYSGFQLGSKAPKVIATPIGAKPTKSGVSHPGRVTQAMPGQILKINKPGGCKHCGERM